MVTRGITSASGLEAHKLLHNGREHVKLLDAQRGNKGKAGIGVVVAGNDGSGGLFDLESGVALAGPTDEPVRLFPTRVVDGRLEADVE